MFLYPRRPIRHERRINHEPQNTLPDSGNLNINHNPIEPGIMPATEHHPNPPTPVMAAGNRPNPLNPVTVAEYNHNPPTPVIAAGNRPNPLNTVTAAENHHNPPNPVMTAEHHLNPPNMVRAAELAKINNEPVLFTQAQVDLMNMFRLLWEQHSVWTRSAIISIAFGLPDADAVTERLLRNPVDFGQVLKLFYGERIAFKFSELLKGHLVIAAQLVKAAKAGNTREAEDLEKQWYANADEIAVLLGSINPYWSTEVWREMLHEHLRLVKSEAVSILTGKYSAGVEVYDEIEMQSLDMADMLSEGIIRQFPNRFM